MNKEEVWEDEKHHIMHITRRHLATLDPKFIPELQDHVLQNLKSRIEIIRSEANAILQAIYPTEAEVKLLDSMTIFLIMGSAPGSTNRADWRHQ